jgi:hypothetical protein
VKSNYTNVIQSPFSPRTLRHFLRKHRTASLPQLKKALGSSATMTVFRKLKALGYRSSYSHRGKFYTLDSLPRFDSQGLWSHGDVWFSRYGNLLQTAAHWVTQAQAGFTAAELQSQLHVEVKTALLRLYRRREIYREELGGVYVYLAAQPHQRQRQRMCRLNHPLPDVLEGASLGAATSQELRAAIILFFSLLDEKQRRLYAGLESFKLGHGGDRQIAQFLDLDVHTVARGRRQLFGGEVQPGRVRRHGGGRVPVEKKRRKSSPKSPN